MPYVEFTPDPSLAHLVKCVFAFDADANEKDGRPERVVPDGNPELVVHFGHPFAEFDDGKCRRRQPRVFIMGQMTRALELDPSQGAPALVGVRFRPWGLRALLGAAMTELTDKRLNVADVAPRPSELLADEIASAATLAARVRVLQRFVARTAEANEKYQDALPADVTKRIARANGSVRLAPLAQDCDLSLRQLERRFMTQIGTTPREYANVVRFRSVFDKMNCHGRPDLAALANDAGYFDQSHMNRDFKRFLGFSPSAYLKQLRGLLGAPPGHEDDVSCRVVTRRATPA